ncbi:hypothetical protein AMTRI_Chr09g18030 [Amborella trichopoda]
MQPSRHATTSAKPYHKEVYHSSDCEVSNQSMHSKACARLYKSISQRGIPQSQSYTPTPERTLSPAIVPIPRITITSRLSWPPFVQLSHIIHSLLKPPSYTLTFHDPTSCHACPYARPRYRQVCSTTLPSGVAPMLGPVIPSRVT